MAARRHRRTAEGRRFRSIVPLMGGRRRRPGDTCPPVKRGCPVHRRPGPRWWQRQHCRLDTIASPAAGSATEGPKDVQQLNSGPQGRSRLRHGPAIVPIPADNKLSELAPLPARSAPSVGKDERRCFARTLLHLGLPVRATHLSLDFPAFAVGPDVDVPACQPDAAVPPVMLYSHPPNPKAGIDKLALGNLVKVSRHLGICRRPNRSKSVQDLRGGHLLGRKPDSYSE